jgi:hypothetical protein
MSKFDSDLEELLLLDVSVCDDSSSTDVELESLLGSLDVGEPDPDTYSIAEHVGATQSREQFGNYCGGGIVTELTFEASYVTKDSHSHAIEDALFNGDDESETGEVHSTASSILAKVLSEFEEGDDGFDLESISNAENDDSTYLSSLGRATRKEGKGFSDKRLGPHCGPLDSFLSMRKCPAQPVEKFSFSSLDEITSKVGLSVTITAMHIETTSISVGTNDGTVTVYSHDQKVLKTFHHSDLASPVTAIGIAGTRNCLICGYETGVIALWNLHEKAQQNLLLLYIDDLHSSPLQFLKVVQKITSTAPAKSDNVVTFLSSDFSGATYRVEIKKSIFMKYSYESECLLTGQASSSDNDKDRAQSSKSSGSGSGLGHTTSLSVLPPPNRTGPLTISQSWLKMEVMAFSAKNKTFVVQLRPRVQILHRWNANPLSYTPVAAVDASVRTDAKEEKSNSDQGTVTDSGSGSEKSVNSVAIKPVVSLSLPLTWSWGGVEAQSHPLLLRVCGSCIQVLSLSLPVTGVESQNTEQKGGGAITFSAAEHTFEDLTFITAKWAAGDGSSVAALTDTHLLILSYPSFSITDKVSLLPDMCTALTLPGSRSPLDRRSAELKKQASDLHLMFEICGDEFYFFPMPRRAANVSSGNASLAFKAPMCFYRIASNSQKRHEYETSVLFLVQQGKWLEALGLCMQSSNTAAEEGSDHLNGSLDRPLASDRNVFADSLIKKYAMIAVYRHSLFTATERIGEGRRGVREGDVTGGLKRNTLGSYRHYQLAAQVCIQFCAAFGLTDTLFQDICEMFRITGQEYVFLIAVADSVMSSRRSQDPLHGQVQGLHCLPLPVIVSMEKAADDAAYHDSPLSVFDLTAFEQCVLCLDKAAQEQKYGLRGIPEVMMKHNLFSGLLWSLSSGSRDCREVFALAFKHYKMAYSKGSSADSSATAAEGEMGYLSRSLSLPLVYPFPSIPAQQSADGYKLLVFLLHALSHRLFPSGEPDPAPSSPRTTRGLLGLLEEIVTHSPSHPHSTLPLHSHNQEEGDDAVRGSYPYLSALSRVDPEALLHILALGIKNISHGHGISSSAIDSLYIRIFHFASDSDVCESERLLSSSCSLERSMTERFFSYCSEDLLSHSTSALPTEMVIAHIRYFAAQPEGPATSGTLDPICTLILGEVPCTHCVSSEKDMEKKKEKEMSVAFEMRRRALLDCLMELECWCAVLLFEAGCCILSPEEERDLAFENFHLVTALTYFTKPTSVPPIKGASRTVFQYLRLCSVLVAGQVSISNFRDTVTVCAADPAAWAYAAIAPPSSLSTDAAAESAVSHLVLFRRHLADYVLDLASIDLIEAKHMACAVYATDMEQLIAATDSSQRIQFELLSAVMDCYLNSDYRLMQATSTLDDSPPPAIDSSVYLRYVGLLLAENPTGLFHFLLRSKQANCLFPVGDCLLLCTEALMDIQVAMLRPSGSDTNTDSNTTKAQSKGHGQGRTRWILLDSISLLKQLSGDLNGAISAIIEYITFALSEERRRKGTPPTLSPTPTSRSLEEGASGPGADKGLRVIHGVQCLLQLCETENSKPSNLHPHIQSREGMWFGALTSLLPILGQCRTGIFGVVQCSNSSCVIVILNCICQENLS